MSVTPSWKRDPAQVVVTDFVTHGQVGAVQGTPLTTTEVGVSAEFTGQFKRLCTFLCQVLVLIQDGTVNTQVEHTVAKLRCPVNVEIKA